MLVRKKQGRGRYKNIIVSLRATAGFTNVAEFYRLSPVCGHDLSTYVLIDGCMDFSENLYTHYTLSENVHLEFSY